MQISKKLMGFDLEQFWRKGKWVWNSSNMQVCFFFYWPLTSYLHVLCFLNFSCLMRIVVSHGEHLGSTRVSARPTRGLWTSNVTAHLARCTTRSSHAKNLNCLPLVPLPKDATPPSSLWEHLKIIGFRLQYHPRLALKTYSISWSHLTHRACLNECVFHSGTGLMLFFLKRFWTELQLIITGHNHKYLINFTQKKTMISSSLIWWTLNTNTK